MFLPDLSVVIHGHFYQPPRENPWFETVEAQPSAVPCHDWNERVTRECYRAVAAARIPGEGGRIARIVNTLESMSFNFGPTLLEWIETEAPGVYQAILDADDRSRRRNSGFGNAIAQAYHHTILPLASLREKRTEVRWGIADFKRRFRRNPLGMWLPETAVDAETLDVLAQEGILFTILAPHQVKEAPPAGRPALFRTSGNRTITLFVYNGPLSHGVAFGSHLRNAEKWARDMKGAAEPGAPDGQGRLVSIATDGETYGHHHRFGEMALASVLNRLHADPHVLVENFASFLSRNPPEHEVELEEPSSWSCSHGVERWRSACGCRIDPSADSQQEWRSSLRDAVDWLATEIHGVFEAEGQALLGDPWAARDRAGVPESSGRVEIGTTLSVRAEMRARELLELERYTLRLFTSCGWFFDDLARIEPIQVLRYAARALELTGPVREELEDGFLKRLDSALTNEDPPRTGRAVFLEEAKPTAPGHVRVAAGAALLDVVRTAVEGSLRGTGESGNADDDGTFPSSAVPGYRVSSLGSGEYDVRHNRTGRRWIVETRILRPSDGYGVVAAREVDGIERPGAEAPTNSFTALAMEDLPEAYRLPVAETLEGTRPDATRALIAAVKRLADGAQEVGSLKERIQEIQELVDLRILLGKQIPFDAQTLFFQALEAAPPEVAQALAALRVPLGFTPDS